MKKRLLSLILAGSIIAGSCATQRGPFTRESFKPQENTGILGYQTLTYLNANNDGFLDRIQIKSRKVIYEEGSKDGFSNPTSLLELDNDENPVGVVYSGKRLSIHTTKGVHNFRLNN